MSPFDRDFIARWIVFGLVLATMWWGIYQLVLLVSDQR